MSKYILAILLLILSDTLFSQTSKLVQGKLVDAKNERAVKDVTIVIQNIESKDSLIVKTNSVGEFQFKNVPFGNYEFKVADKTYKRDSTFTFDITEAHAEHFTFGEPITAELKVSWLFNWGDRTMTDANGKVYVKEHYWSHLVGKIILACYGIFLLLIFFYSVLQFNLAITYAKNKKKARYQDPEFNPDIAPKVTVQLPMFNEMYVADRIIDACAAFDYPKDKLQIQVLDDSTDETKDLIAKKVAEVAATGVNIQHIHRVDRTGYKAGALDAAMDQVEGDFIAIFDADFIPEPDFLKRTTPYFQDENVGVVQTRWGHLNKDYSLLTELQAFGLNGHFAIEQGGRNSAGHFINFNGTGGIWRKTCIEDAGGWEHDTLTEDLDLSYRAQMKGWRFQYLEDVVSPAELPITMSALKSQQHRWMKGGVECFKKMWKRLLTTKGVKLADRVHGISHLFNSSVFLFIIMVAILSLAVLHVKDSFSDLNYILRFMSIFIVSTLFLMVYYWYSFRDRKENGKKSFFGFVGRFFQFLTMSMGMSINNTVAVIEGYMGIKSSFVRTPKFNVSRKSEFKQNKYDKKKLNLVNVLEGIFAVVFLFTAINRAIYGDLGMVPFHLMLGIGFGMVFYYSVKEVREANRA
jgi:cellulose synthase/poly-beta-1,6-N-acetylglucosamine synthase-like glycosyltransferase